MANNGSYRWAVNSGVPSSSVLLSFALWVFVAGASAVAVRFTVVELAPFWGATIRFAASAAIFAVITLIRRDRMPRDRTLAGVLIYGVLNFGVSYALVYFAIQEMTAGFAMVIMALTPLLTFLFAVFHRLEPFRWRALLGTVLALSGIALAFAGQTDGGMPLWAVLLMVASSICYAEATVVLKMLPPISPLTANALGMAVGTLLLAILSLAAGETWALPRQTQTWTAIIYLIVFGSVTAFYLAVYIIQQWTVTASSYAVVLAPFVTVPLGALLAGEEVTAELLLGAVIVLAAVFVGISPAEPDKQTGMDGPITGNRRAHP